MQLLGRQTSIEIVNILFSVCLYTNLLKLEKDFYDEDEVEASSIFLMQVMRVYEMIMIVPPVSYTCIHTQRRTFFDYKYYLIKY